MVDLQSHQGFKRDLKGRLKALPKKPGVYLMKNSDGDIIYVGKAKVLANRVRSYFGGGKYSPKINIMIGQISDFEYIVTGSELEALLLESTLIKRHRPKYNIRFKDDKRYMYIKIDTQNAYPRLQTERRVKIDEARYFGPHTSSKSVWQTFGLLRKLFKIRTCNLNLETQKRKRPCLDYHIKLCSAPCVDYISKTDYQASVNETCLFLDGKQSELIEQLHAAMQIAADNQEYEEAARIRDRLQAIEHILEMQRVVSTDPTNRDIIAFARSGDIVCVQILFIRRGKLAGQSRHLLEGTASHTSNEILNEFIKQYYIRSTYIPTREGHIPREILSQNEIDDITLITKWIKERERQSVRIKTATTAQDSRLLSLAQENAQAELTGYLKKPEVQRQKLEQALKGLQHMLNLPHTPIFIDAFDISTLHGTHSVGSLVVFEGGGPRKKHYRRYKIKNVEGINDFAMMQEVIRRRYKRVIQKGEPLTDLILVDGGKGQLNAALEILNELNLNEIPIIGLAKRLEEVFVPNKVRPVHIPPNHPSLFLLQHIRDEAHRFAISYHRKLRKKTLVKSSLDQVPGLGPAKRKMLLQHFGDIQTICQITPEQLSEIPGISKKLAIRILKALKLQPLDNKESEKT